MKNIEWIKEIPTTLLELIQKYGFILVFAVIIIITIIYFSKDHKDLKELVVKDFLSLLKWIVIVFLLIYGYDEFIQRKNNLSKDKPISKSLPQEENKSFEKYLQKEKLKKEIDIPLTVHHMDKKQDLEEEIQTEKMFYEEDKVEEDITFSLEDTVFTFINNMNQRTEEGYNNSYNFFSKYLSMSQETYLKYWSNHQAQFILSDINKSNHSFSVIIDFDESPKDIFNTYKVIEDNNQFYIEDKTGKLLYKFDDWKINNNEQLKYSNKKDVQGKLYKRKPTISSKIAKEKVEAYDAIAYLETDEGRFYLTQYSLNKLIEDRPEVCNWIYEVK